MGSKVRLGRFHRDRVRAGRTVPAPPPLELDWREVAEAGVAAGVGRPSGAEKGGASETLTPDAFGDRLAAGAARQGNLRAFGTVPNTSPRNLEFVT